MGFSQLIAFALAYLAILILPGPGVTAVVARVLARGLTGTPAFIAGFVAGAVLWLIIAATGLSVLATQFAALFIAVRYAGAAYLIYLAWKFWTAPARSMGSPDSAPEGRFRLFLTGLSINLGNPKVIVFFIALLPTVVDLASLTPFGFIELGMAVFVIASGVLTAYALAAARARRLFTSARSARLVNRVSSVVLTGTAISIATR